MSLLFKFSSIFKLFICLVLILNTNINGVQAEKLCIKKNQRVNNNRVRLSKVLKTETTCPKRSVEVLDTTTFKGEQGESGTANLSVTSEVSSDAPSLLTNGFSKTYESTCSSGILIGGGCTVNDDNFQLVDSYLNFTTGKWRCKYSNFSGGALNIQISVIVNCLNT